HIVQTLPQGNDLAMPVLKGRSKAIRPGPFGMPCAKELNEAVSTEFVLVKIHHSEGRHRARGKAVELLRSRARYRLPSCTGAPPLRPMMPPLAGGGAWPGDAAASASVA